MFDVTFFGEPRSNNSKNRSGVTRWFELIPETRENLEVIRNSSSPNRLLIELHPSSLPNFHRTFDAKGTYSFRGLLEVHFRAKQQLLNNLHTVLWSDEYSRETWTNRRESAKKRRRNDEESTTSSRVNRKGKERLTDRWWVRLETGDKLRTIKRDAWSRIGLGPSRLVERVGLTGANWRRRASLSSTFHVPLFGTRKRKKVGFDWPFLFRESTSLLLATKTGGLVPAGITARAFQPPWKV